MNAEMNQQALMHARAEASPIPRLRPAKRYLEDNFTGEVNLAKAARLSGLSRSHFARAFKACMGAPPYRWVLQARIRRAQTLLARHDDTIASISIEVGFSDQSHFSRTFKRLTGDTPGRWQRNHGRRHNPALQSGGGGSPTSSVAANQNGFE